MVPEEVVDAAISGSSDAVDAVVAWLDSPDGDPNDADRYGGTLLARACQCLSPNLGRELTRLLLERGARFESGRTFHRQMVLHNTCYSHDAEWVGLLLGAGADPNEMMPGDMHSMVGYTKYSALFCYLRNRDPNREFALDVVRVLLRAGASLDFHDGEEHLTAEAEFESMERHFDNRGFGVFCGGPPEVMRPIREGRAMVRGVRAAGSWRSYVRLPHKAMLALRSLRVHGRAVPTPATPPHLDRLLSPATPSGVVWHILEYWLEAY